MRIFLIIYFILTATSFATLTATYTPCTKTGGTSPVLQNCTIIDTGTSSGFGNVGVGSTSPGRKLDVQGTVRIISTQVGTPTLDVQGTLRRFLDTNSSTCTCCTTSSGSQSCAACSCAI